MRILELGRVPFLKTVYPELTDYFDLTPRAPSKEAPSGIGFGQIVSGLRADEYDFVACQPEPYAPWRWQAVSRMLFRRSLFTRGTSPHRPYALELLRFVRQTPIAVMDFDDPSTIDASALPLLDACTLYFKRELPVDEWNVFSGTITARVPSKRFRQRAHNLKRVAKLRPLPLGLPLGTTIDPGSGKTTKTSDVFFAVSAQGLPARQRALAELDVLRSEGYRIDAPEGLIPREEFYRRCASAWLVLSPEGYGWDCFRHYEAAACESVPLMNYPSIRRYQPFIEGESGLYYAPEPGGLAAAARGALADKARLARIAAAATALTAASHTPQAISRYVIDCMADYKAKHGRQREPSG